MKRLLLLGAFAIPLAFGQISVGIRIGAPPPPRVVVEAPPQPGPEFVWIGGYWYADGHKWRWHEGYWTRPPYAGAHWVPARHDGERFFEGYWEGERGRVDHSHKWHRDRDRDYREDHGRR